MTVLFGVTVAGSRSWLTLGGMNLEPSELVKILIIIFLAGYLDENKEVLRLGTRRVGRFLLPDWPYLGPLLAAIGLSLLLLVFQKDIGMALLFFSLFISMVYAATGRLSHLLSGLLLFFGGASPDVPDLSSRPGAGPGFYQPLAVCSGRRLPDHPVPVRPGRRRFDGMGAGEWFSGIDTGGAHRFYLPPDR